MTCTRISSLISDLMFTVRLTSLHVLPLKLYLDILGFHGLSFPLFLTTFFILLTFNLLHSLPPPPFLPPPPPPAAPFSLFFCTLLVLQLEEPTSIFQSVTCILSVIQILEVLNFLQIEILKL